MDSVTTIQRCCYNAKAAIDDTETNEPGYIAIKHSLWTLKFESHKIFTCYKMLFFF